MTTLWTYYVEWWAVTIPATLLVMALIAWRLVWLHRIARELCTDNQGRLSQNKIWAHVAKAAATAVFIKQGLFVSPPPSLESLSWLLLVYAGIVGGSELAAKAMNLKWGNNHTQPSVPPPSPPSPLAPGGPGSMPAGPYPSPSGPIGG